MRLSRPHISLPRISLRLRSSVFVCALAIVAAAGCTVCQHAKRTLFEEPAQYSAKRDRPRSVKLYREWADQQWQLFAGDCGHEVASEEFEAGFRDGFVDYVYAGGTGEPPPLPPRKFWNAAYRNPDGHVGSADWFNGYRTGAAIARDGGFRRAAIVRSSYELGYASDMWDEPSGTGEPLPNSEVIPPPPAEPTPLPQPQLNPPALPHVDPSDSTVFDELEWETETDATGHSSGRVKLAQVLDPEAPPEIQQPVDLRRQPPKRSNSASVQFLR
ncbi:MAG: hypothetical protein KDA44_05050 [Planctomycetales bacterium]|nr:hypothetical protein [Planctomycetales bacterium]